MTALERTGGTVGAGGADLRQALGSLDIELVSGSGAAGRQPCGRRLDGAGPAG